MNQQTKDDLMTVAEYDMTPEVFGIAFKFTNEQALEKEYLTLDKLFEIADKLDVSIINFWIQSYPQKRCTIGMSDTRKGCIGEGDTPQLALLSALASAIREME